VFGVASRKSFVDIFVPSLKSPRVCRKVLQDKERKKLGGAFKALDRLAQSKISLRMFFFTLEKKLFKKLLVTVCHGRQQRCQGV
jgi:hypothetical protein